MSTKVEPRKTSNSTIMLRGSGMDDERRGSGLRFCDILVIDRADLVYWVGEFAVGFCLLFGYVVAAGWRLRCPIL